MEIKNKNSGGYTLVELLVVTATFVIIVVTSVDLFVLMISHQRRILAEQELSSQVSYVAEYMSRALRMATTATDTSCINSVGKTYQVNTDKNSIKFFNNSSSTCQEFLLQDGRIKEIKGSGSAIPLTADSLIINEFNVEVYGDETGDLSQPRVTIATDIENQTKDAQLVKRIQITVSKRNIDE